MNTTQSTFQHIGRPENHRFRKLSILPAIALLAFVQGCATNQGGSDTKTTSDGDYGMSVATTNTVASTPSGTSGNTSADQPSVDSSNQATAKETPVAATPKPVTPVEPASTSSSTTKKVEASTVKKKEPTKTQKPVKAKTEVKKEKEVAKTPVKKTVKPVESKAETKPVISTEKSDKKAETQPQEVQVALAEPTSPESNMPVVEEAVSGDITSAAITGEDLPYDFGTWTLERNWDNQHPDTCRLVSSMHKISDGYELTNIRAEVLLDGINIYTGSNIDLTYENSGIQIDSLSLVPYSGLIGESNATVQGDFTEMLANAGEMTVNLGFWPTWPKTETQQLVLPLEDMRLAIPAMLNCKNL
ncbi:hypothetical protein BTA51_12545 [Hahella sp. CCB-MM4]|uniref:hypothetical protein n=1 Tax=Hahella sp. (strain CCB-MM4) TaxID=1926491 RepID=UPI000B9A89CC|nr:hypothetical protein [Hahella sp. CCB-MM4]OZG73296.1 hypothetical protein BTA51_12545 [Hahella sp. CCB-MM4]